MRQGEETDSMKYKIGICDDECIWRDQLSQMVTTWSKHKNAQIQIMCYESAEEFLFKEGNVETDILFLDIEMKEMNGVELAGKVRQGNKEMQIVFVTGYMDYIQEGYDVEALHYLLKPVTEEKIGQVLDRAVKRLETSGRTLLLNVHGELVRVPCYEIRYLEVCKNYVTIYAKEQYEVKMTLSELEEKLDESFFRTGRSYIVNLRFIRRISKTEIILNSGESIPMPRGMYDKVNQAMIRFF